MSAADVLLDAAAATRPLVASPAVAARWEEPSPLAGMTVGALAGHLLRALTTMLTALDGDPDTSAPPLDAPGYFLSVGAVSGPGGPDLGSPLHVGVRERAAAEAAGGAGDVLARWDAAFAVLADRLPREDPHRLVAARDGRPLPLAEYAITRLVELVVHGDDLAAGVGALPPPLADEAHRLVVECLVGVAARRHGWPAVVRALARRERDAVEALRVL